MVVQPKRIIKYRNFSKEIFDPAEVEETEVPLCLTAADELVVPVVLLVVLEVCAPIPPSVDAEPLSVVISGAATVMFVMAIPLAVYAQRQYGDSVGMKSPVVDEP